MGQIVVTPEVVASTINNMKENKSPGIDGISPKILKETVEQISPPLAHVFNMLLQEGIVPLEWKEANIEMGGTILSTTVKEKDLGVTMNANMKVSELQRLRVTRLLE